MLHVGEVVELVGCWSNPRAGGGHRRFLRDRDCRRAPVRTQVIGFRDGRVLSMPLEETDGISWATA